MPWIRVGTVSTPVTFPGNAQGVLPGVAGGGTGYWSLRPSTTSPSVPRPVSCSLLDIDHTVHWTCDVEGRGRLVITVPSAEIGAMLFLEVHKNGEVLLRFDGQFSGELECLTEGEVHAGDQVEYVCVQGNRFVPIAWQATPAS